MYNNNPINYGQVPMASTVPVGPQQPQQFPVPQAPIPATGYPQQPSYGVDQTSFAGPGPMPAPAPAVSVGFFDRVKSYFNDVYSSSENLRAYKTFQQQVDSDPYTLKPGSRDSTRIMDLQQKLNIAGVQANVNGVYGYATGEAVKEFKVMMNINDGFLDGDGKPAVTDIATRQVQQVLDSIVSKTLNPQRPGVGNPMPVTQEELMWAQNLANKIQHFGYTPNAQEQARYNDIHARQQQQQAGGPAPIPGPQVPTVPNPNMPMPQQPVPQQPVQNTQAPMVSQAELEWAMDLQQRIVQGYNPNPQEAQMYDDIQRRYAAQQAQQAGQPATGPVSEDELAWVRSKAGQQLSPDDMARYQNIMDRYMSQQTGGTQTAPATSGELRPVTQAELQWAIQLEEKMATGYQPTPEEAQRYTDIYNRYQTQPQPDPVTASPSQPPQVDRPGYNPGPSPGVSVDNSVSTEELQWAADLQRRIDTEGYRPSQQEIIRYTDIFKRHEASKNAPVQPTQPTVPNVPNAPTGPAPLPGQTPQAQPGATQEEVQWARQLESRSASGHQPSAADISRYNDIQRRLANHGIRASNPIQPVPNNAPVSQAEIDWAMQLQHAIQFQNYQPTQQQVDAYTEIFTRYQAQLAAQATPAIPQQPPVSQQPAIPTQPTAPTQNLPTGPVSQEEMQWAQQLQQLVQQGYQANAQEMAIFENIYQRQQQFGAQQPQAPQQPVAPQQPYSPPATQTPPGSVMINVGAADPELQFALELLERYRQGYQPTQSEMMMYERIIAQKGLPNATP